MRVLELGVAEDGPGFSDIVHISVLRSGGCARSCRAYVLHSQGLQRIKTGRYLFSPM